MVSIECSDEAAISGKLNLLLKPMGNKFWVWFHQLLSYSLHLFVLSISRSNNCSLVVFWSVVCNHILSLLPSQSFDKKQIFISLHPQTTTPNKQTFLRLQTLPWTGTPIAIEFNIPLPQEGQSLSKASHLILFRAQPLGGVGTSRKAPEPDQLILFTERRHVGGKKKYKCWYCRLQICEL